MNPTWSDRDPSCISLRLVVVTILDALVVIVEGLVMLVVTLVALLLIDWGGVGKLALSYNRIQRWIERKRKDRGLWRMS